MRRRFGVYLRGVVDEVADHLRQARRIAHHPQRGIRQAARRSVVPGRVDRAAGCFRAQLDDRRMSTRSCCSTTLPVAMRDTSSRSSIRLHHAGPSAAPSSRADARRCAARRPAFSSMCSAGTDRRERVAQLVREHGQEFVLAPVGFAQRLLGSRLAISWSRIWYWRCRARSAACTALTIERVETGRSSSVTLPSVASTRSAAAGRLLAAESASRTGTSDHAGWLPSACEQRLHVAVDQRRLGEHQRAHAARRTSAASSRRSVQTMHRTCRPSPAARRSPRRRGASAAGRGRARRRAAGQRHPGAALRPDVERSRRVDRHAGQHAAEMGERLAEMHALARRTRAGGSIPRAGRCASSSRRSPSCTLPSYSNMRSITTESAR